MCAAPSGGGQAVTNNTLLLFKLVSFYSIVLLKLAYIKARGLKACNTVPLEVLTALL